VVNLSGTASQGRVPLAWPDLAGRTCQITDLLSHDQFTRDGDELARPGLFVSLEPWQFHLLTLR
jgi:hypothetical protein